MPTEILVEESHRKYHWPETQLNLWVLVMMAASCCEVGFFAYLMVVQEQMRIGVIWLFPFWITSGSITIAFIFTMLFLTSQRMLMPGVILMGAFILWVLWLTGLIETAVQLFGANGNINATCSTYVNHMASTGPTGGTLTWLEQKLICNLWLAGFSFALVGTLFHMWMMMIAYQVQADRY